MSLKCNNYTEELKENRINKFKRIGELLNIKEVEVDGENRATYTLNDCQCLFIYINYRNEADISLRPLKNIHGISINDIYLDRNRAYIKFGFNPDRDADSLAKYFKQRFTEQLVSNHHAYISEAVMDRKDYLERELKKRTVEDKIIPELDDILNKELDSLLPEYIKKYPQLANQITLIRLKLEV